MHGGLGPGVGTRTNNIRCADNRFKPTTFESKYPRVDLGSDWHFGSIDVPAAFAFSSSSFNARPQNRVHQTKSEHYSFPTLLSSPADKSDIQPWLLNQVCQIGSLTCQHILLTVVPGNGLAKLTVFGPSPKLPATLVSAPPTMASWQT